MDIAGLWIRPAPLLPRSDAVSDHSARAVRYHESHEG